MGKDLKDSLLRSLAEQENCRRIAARALDAVPEELRGHEDHAVLATLYEGITMTDQGLNKALAKNGLVKFGKEGEKFDPELHQALFEFPDPEKEAGTIGQVTKLGFLLNKRVLRPAEVGVVKA